MRLEKKEWLLLIPATLLALAGLAPEDPVVIGLCLSLSWLAFIVLCILHEGWKARTRLAVALLITVFVGGIAFRRYPWLFPKHRLAGSEGIPTPSAEVPQPIQQSKPPTDAKKSQESNLAPNNDQGSPNSEKLLKELQDTLKQEAQERNQPIVKRDVINTLIPFIADGHDAGIPLDNSDTDPMRAVYNEMGDIAYIWEGPRFDPVSHKMLPPLELTDAVMREFIGNSVQYYLLRRMHLMTHPMQSINFSTEKGTTLNPVYVINVPEKAEYPNEQLQALLTDMSSRLAFGVNGGRGDWAWRSHKYEVPRGTVISVAENPASPPGSYELRYERQGDYYLSFLVSFTGRNQGLGAMPVGFKPITIGQITEAYCYFVLITMEFKWYGRDHTNTNEYRDWATAIFDAFKKQLMPPQN